MIKEALSIREGFFLYPRPNNSYISSVCHDITDLLLSMSVS